MKVLHVITGLNAGGAEQQLRLLLRHMDADSEVVTLTDPGAVAEGLRSDGVRVAHLGMRGNRDLGALPRLTGLIRAGRYDLVHTHLYRACLYGRVAARLAGVRAVVATEHSLGDTHMEGRPLTPGVRALYLAGERLGRATVAVSESVAERLRRWGVPAGRIHLVPNGIDAGSFRHDPAARELARRELGFAPEEFVVGGVGRLVPGKSFDILVRALPQLPENCRLLLVGTGPEAGPLRALAAALGVGDRLVLAGERAMTDSPGRASLPSLLSAMDVLASPSPQEAFGLAIVEGLAAGLPVRYSAGPALTDLPADRTGGAELLPSEPSAYAASLRELQLPGPRRIPVPPAVGHYDIASSARRLTDVHERALAGPHPGGPSS